MSSGVFTQTAGTYTQSLAPVTNGAGAGSNGLMILSGSAVFNHNPAGDNGIWVAESGNGVLHVAGNAALNMAVANNGLQLGRVAAGVGIVNLRGGTITTRAVAKGAGIGHFNFDGGVLKANQDNATFVAGLTNAFVRPGGAIIDDGGFNVTITQALAAPVNQGVLTIPVTSGGSGYLDTPIVTFTGGTGVGASALVNLIDDGLGQGTFSIGSITVTNAGDYTVLPTAAALLGGGNGVTAAVLGALTTGANASGPLTKLGTGTLALTGANTYTGDTTINAGVLSIASAYLSNSAAVRLNGSGKLNLNFVGTDLVNSLFFNSVAQATGTWGATGSGASNINDTFFSGTGVIQVVPEPQTFLLAIGAVTMLVSSRRRRG